MIDENIGIRMCKHKRIRREYGTIVYNPTIVVLPNPKIHYDEIYQLMKKEKKQAKKEKKVTKKIDLTKISGALGIDPKEEDLIIPLKEEAKEAKEEPKEEPKEEAKEEPKEAKEEPKEEAKEDKEEAKEEPKEEPKEESKDQKQAGGLLKRIMITNLSLDKDKEMFQM